MAIISIIPSQITAGQALPQSQKPTSSNYCKLLSENKESHEMIYEVIIHTLISMSPLEGFDEEGVKKYYPYHINGIIPLKKLWESIDDILHKNDNITCKKKNEEIWNFMRTNEFRKLAEWGGIAHLIDWKLMLITQLKNN